MTSKFKQRLKRLHDSRLRAADATEVSAEPRVYLADDVFSEVLSPKNIEKPAVSTAKIQQNQGFRLFDQLYADTHRHGNYVLGKSRTSAFNAIAGMTRCATFDGFQAEEIVYLDIETTGLGQYSYAFCVGLGLWVDGGFLVEQYVMGGKNDEAEMLAGLSNRLLAARGLCTFNGQRFDVPRLEARYAHHGITSPFSHLHDQHVDLLPISRKQLKGHKSYRLGALEQNVLRLFRVDDVPGKDIPPLWNRYLKTGQETLLAGVFEHNRIDIVSMPVLLSVLLNTTSAFEKPQSIAMPRVSRPTGNQDMVQPQDSGSIGARLKRSYALRDRNAKTPASPSNPESPRTPVAPVAPGQQFTDGGYATIGERSQVLREAATILIARGQTSEALPMLFELATLSPENPFPLEHLARYYRALGNQVFAEHFERRLRASVSF